MNRNARGWSLPAHYRAFFRVPALTWCPRCRVAPPTAQPNKLLARDLQPRHRLSRENSSPTPCSNAATQPAQRPGPRAVAGWHQRRHSHHPLQAARLPGGCQVLLRAAEPRRTGRQRHGKPTHACWGSPPLSASPALPASPLVTSGTPLQALKLLPLPPMSRFLALLPAGLPAELQGTRPRCGAQHRAPAAHQPAGAHSQPRAGGGVPQRAALARDVPQLLAFAWAEVAGSVLQAAASNHPTQEVFEPADLHAQPPARRASACPPFFPKHSRFFPSCPPLPAAGPQVWHSLYRPHVPC
jgi:hypothetical protein